MVQALELLGLHRVRDLLSAECYGGGINVVDGFLIAVEGDGAAPGEHAFFGDAEGKVPWPPVVAVLGGRHEELVRGLRAPQERR